MTLLRDIPDDWQHADIDRAIAFVNYFRLAIDVGAHRGVVTAKLLTRFARVVAIEPGPLADRIPVAATVVRAAVGAVPGRCGMAEGTHNTGQRHVTAGDDVKVITLDSLGLVPGFIKLDVEGMEHAALLGGEQTIRRHKPIIMLEENGLNRRYGVPDDESRRLLESWGARLALTIGERPRDTDQIFAW